jgi:hypothetical protein
MGPGFVPTSIAVQDNDGTPHCEGRDDSVLVQSVPFWAIPGAGSESGPRLEACWRGSC